MKRLMTIQLKIIAYNKIDEKEKKLLTKYLRIKRAEM